jgi:hypothetical protein
MLRSNTEQMPALVFNADGLSLGSVSCLLSVSGLNPNPKTAADFRKNGLIMNEMNKNHEDDLFQHEKVTFLVKIYTLDRWHNFKNIFAENIGVFAQTTASFAKT